MVELPGTKGGERQLQGESDFALWARGGLAGRERAMGEQQAPFRAGHGEGAHTGARTHSG